MSYYKSLRNASEAVILDNLYNGYSTAWDSSRRQYVRQPMKPGPNRLGLGYIRELSGLRSRFNVGIVLNLLFISLLREFGDSEGQLTGNMFRIASAQSKTVGVYDSISNALKRYALPAGSKLEKYISQEIKSGTERISRNMAFLDAWAQDYGLMELLAAIQADTGLTLHEFTEQFNEEYYKGHKPAKDAPVSIYFEERNAAFHEEIKKIAENHGIDLHGAVAKAISERNDRRTERLRAFQKEKRRQKLEQVREQAKIMNDRANSDIYNAMLSAGAQKKLSAGCAARLKKRLACAGGDAWYFTRVAGKVLYYYSAMGTWATTPYNLMLVPLSDKEAADRLEKELSGAESGRACGIIERCSVSLPPELRHRIGQLSGGNAIGNLIEVQQSLFRRVLDSSAGINITLWMHLYRHLLKFGGEIWYGLKADMSAPCPELKYLVPAGGKIVERNMASRFPAFPSEESCREFYKGMDPASVSSGNFVAAKFVYRLPPGFYDRMVQGLFGDIVENSLENLCILLGYADGLGKDGYSSEEIMEENGLFPGFLFCRDKITAAQISGLLSAIKGSEKGIRMILSMDMRENRLSNPEPPIFLHARSKGVGQNIGAIIGSAETEEAGIRHVVRSGCFSEWNRFDGVYADIGNAKECGYLDRVYIDLMKKSACIKACQFVEIVYDAEKERFLSRHYAPERLHW